MSPRYKIIFLPRWYPTEEDIQNGIFIQKHARAAAKNNEVVVIFPTPTPNQSRISKITSGNLTELIIYYRKTPFTFLNLIKYAVNLFRGWKIMKKYGFRPDIAHINMLSRPALLGLWLKWKLKVPLILSEHWSGYMSGNFRDMNSLKKWFGLYAAKKANLITAVSEPHKKAMMDCGFKTKIEILPNVVEVSPDATKRQPVSDRFRFLVVADLQDKIKNITGIIHAFIEVHQQDPLTELVIIGDGPDRQKLQEIAQNFPVSFRGEKNNAEVLETIPEAHVIIINSRFETFSVITLEAIFSGRPVIATRCGGPEQFINNRNGILIDKDNDKELAQSMWQIKEHYDQYTPEKVKNSLENQYNPESVARLMNGYYNQLVDADIGTD